MSDVKRYDPDDDVDMYEVHDGEWVKFEDFNALVLRLDDRIKTIQGMADIHQEQARRIVALESRLEEAQNHATQWADLAGSHGAMQDGIRRLFEGERAKRIELERMLSRLAEWRETYRGEELPKLFGILDDVQSRVVEKHERICGVPDPDDECEECIRPLGHDGEHDFSTPPE